MNLTVPVVTGRLRRKSIAAEVVHCLTDLRLDADENGTPTGHQGPKQGRKRRGSLGGEAPVRRPSLVSRWFKHISDAAEAYKVRTKGTHDYSEDASGNSGQTPKDSFETVSETHKIEQISTPIDRLERKDSGHQCRAVSTGGTTPSTGSGNTHPSSNNNNSTTPGGGLNNNEDSLPNKNRSPNEIDENVDNEEKELIKRRSLLADQEYNGSGGGGSDDEQQQSKDGEDGGQRGRVANNTRTLTQQCSLVAPSEIHVSVSNALTAEPILTPSEKLRRLDQAIRKTLVEKQRVVCDMYKVPDEHFLAIADIAGQPEAPQKEPMDMILAAFAHIQSLTDVLNEHMRVTQSQEISAVSTSICDECSRRMLGGVKPTAGAAAASSSSASSTNATNAVPSTELNGSSPAMDPSKAGAQPTVGVPPIASVLQNDQVSITEDEDGYCEIDEIRAAAVLLESQLEAEKLKKLAAAAEAEAKAASSTDSNPLDDSGGPKSPDSHIEINDNYDTTQPKLTGVDLCGRNRLLHASSLVPNIPCHLIANYVTGLNAQISQLLPKISERDSEREQLRRENQHLRELLNAMHQERVLKSQETTEAPVTDPEPQSQPTETTTNNNNSSNSVNE